MSVGLYNNFAVESVSGSYLDGYSTAASFNSNWIRLENASDYSVQCFVTSTLTGTVKLQCSNEKGTNVTNAVPAIANGIDITGASSTLSAASPVFFNVQNSGYRWFRVVFTVSSGSGAATVIVNCKG